MPVFYLDTSAIVKRYRREEGTEVMDDLLEEPLETDRFYTSLLAALEFTSAMTRLSSASEISEKTAREVLARFHEETRRRLRFWPLDNELLALATSLVSEHKLRSADAIHLATAVTISSVVPEATLILVSSDRELVQAAKALRLSTIDPLEKSAREQLVQWRRLEN